MPWSYKIDPITRDIVKDGKGSFVRVYTAETSVQIAIRAHYSRSWHSPELGSRLHELERFQANPAVEIADETRRALGRLQSIGLISDLEVQATETKPGRVDVRTRFRDASTNQLVDTVVPVGG